MGLTSAIAIFFIVWWITLFAVLPWGNREPDPDHSRVEGAEQGAPARPALKVKLVITTLLSFVIFAGIYLLVTSGLTLEDIPLPSPPGFD
jgi:predicted secreted protein